MVICGSFLFRMMLGTLLLFPLTTFANEPWIAVVISADEAAEKLSKTDLALIFRRKKLFARDGERYQPVNLPADHPLRSRFSKAVLKASPESLEDYWNQQYFQGTLPPHVLESELAVQRFVTATAHAIGYLSHCSVDRSLRIIWLISPQGLLRPGSEAPLCDSIDP